MLQFLRLKNFRSYEDTRLDFIPGVNVIVPRADSSLRNNIGKTNIIRGLDLLVTHRPLGGRFFSDFAGEKGTTEIELGVEEGVVSLTKDVVVKEGKKTVKRAGYSVNGVECKDDYGALKGGIPDVIEKLLNFSDLNIQNQHDGPFLICSSPGEVARVFNRVTKLEKVDQWVSHLTTRINTCNREREIYVTSLEKQEADLRQYKDLPDIEREVQRAEKLQNQIEICDLGLSNVSRMLFQLDEVEEELESQRDLTGAESLVEESLELLGEKQRKEREIAIVEGLVIRLDSIEKEIQECSFLATASPSVDEALALLRVVGEKDRNIRMVENLSFQYDALSDRIKQCNQKRLGLVEEYVTELKRFGKCPTCFAEVNQETLKRIVKEIQGN